MRTLYSYGEDWVSRDSTMELIADVIRKYCSDDKVLAAMKYAQKKIEQGIKTEVD